MGLVGESLKEVQQASSGTVSREGHFGRRTDNGNSVGNAEFVKLRGELVETRRRVVDTVEAGSTAVELVKFCVDVADRLLLGRHGELGNTLMALLALDGKRQPPRGGVFIGLDVAGGEESSLLDGNLIRLLGNCNHGVANLGDPGAHDLIDILARGFAQSVPQSLGFGVAVGMCLEVVGDTLEEGLDAEVVSKHADR